VEIPEVKFSPLFRTMYITSVLLVPDTQALASREPEALPPEIFNIRAGALEVSTRALIALARKRMKLFFQIFSLRISLP
jgi:hypothetical protein